VDARDELLQFFVVHHVDDRVVLLGHQALAHHHLDREFSPNSSMRCLSESGMSVVGQWLRELATAGRRFGYEGLHGLGPREGWRVGRNRVHRIFKLEELQVLMRLRRRKHIRLHRGPVPVTTNGGQY